MKIINNFTKQFYKLYQKNLDDLNIPLEKLVKDGKLSERKKYDLFTSLLEKELWQLYELGDHRTRLLGRQNKSILSQDKFKTPYGTNLFPNPTFLYINGIRDAKNVVSSGLDKTILNLSFKKSKINKYHIEVGSCTGSSSDLESYKYGIKLKNKLLKSNNYKDLLLKCKKLEESIRNDIKEIFRLPNDTKIIFSLSGTDSELILPLFGVNKNYITQETGSGTKYSAQALHSSNITWYGEKIKKGDKIDNDLILDQPEIFPVRKDNEEVLTSKKHFEAKLKYLSKERLDSNNKIIGLHITTHTKTGVGTLTLNQALKIREKYSFDKMIIFADAAQTHLTRKELRSLINNDIIVSITGSKRPGGPIFTNAILISPRMANLLKKNIKKIDGVYKGYSKYFVKNDLKSVIEKKYLSNLADIPNIVQLIKWKVSLKILSKYYTYQKGFRCKSERYLQDLIKQRIKDSNYLKLTKVRKDPVQYGDPQGDMNYIISFHLKYKDKFLNKCELERFQYLLNHNLKQLFPREFASVNDSLLGITGLFGQRVQERGEPASMRICPSMVFFNKLFEKFVNSRFKSSIIKDIFSITISRITDKSEFILKNWEILYSK